MSKFKSMHTLSELKIIFANEQKGCCFMPYKKCCISIGTLGIILIQSNGTIKGHFILA